MDGCTRLCDLVSASLLRFIESKPSRLTKEIEKDMLLSLSLVSHEIQQWTSEFDCESNQGIVANSIVDHYCYRHMGQSFEGDCNCLANIISAVVSFLSVDSQFVQHVAGNILVSISKFPTKYGSRWIELIHLLWISLEAVISSIFSWTLSSSTAEYVTLTDETLMHHYSLTTAEASGSEDSGFDFATFLALLKSRLVNVTWLTVASLFRILRNILKSLKHDYGDLERAFLNLSVSCLIKMPWDLFREIRVSQSFTNQMTSGRHDLQGRINGSTGIKDVLLGTVLQLFCSLIKQADLEDAGSSPLGELPIYSKFTIVMAQLLSCCFSKCLDHNNKHLSRYLKHKMLILMRRVTFYDHWQRCDSVLWLTLLKVYFEDFLYESISECDADRGNCLEGSPFLASNSDRNACTRHLQRQAIFLLFKCCFTLVRRNETGQGCACASEAFSFTNGLQLRSEQHSHSGLWELSEWLRRCGALEKFLGCENYLEACSSFALCFLQLYVEEDDMLFEMLLQLLDASLLLMQIESNTTERSLQEVDRDIVSLFLSIFNPIHLFHLFLFSLHYDHLVLVDYLISKDTGVLCVQYLLRCLRLVCKSWPIFVEFSICGNDINQTCCKRRKINFDKECHEKLGLSSVPTMVIKGQNLKGQTIGSTHKLISVQPFRSAKDCLLSFRGTVEDLHQKKLFPYNPKPLLKSFARFQELCAQ